MANNQYVNKVVKGSSTLIDLTSDTVTASVLMNGYTAHDASGAPITGTASGGVEDGHVYQDANGYIVLDDETGKVYETVTKSYTPTESQQSETITAGSGYDAIEQVNVTVGAISSSYVGSGITRRSSSDLSASGATITAPAGYYASAATKSVASGTEGTPTASKGSVSNHSVTVTPSVTNSAGYISGGTKTGTGVTVSASELVSGTKSISANGTGIDVTDYASVDVSVSGGSATLITKSITQNGTYNASSDNADGYSSVTVSVSGGGGGGDMSDPIRFFDYDGTLIASYTAVPSSLPSVPTHTGLTGGTWNYTLQQITTQFNAMGTCDVGANYTTSSGATEIDIELQAGRLHPYLSLAVNGTVSVDWGDGSTPSTSTGTSLTTRKSDIHHEYSAAGKYTIKIAKTSGTGYSLYCTSTYTLLNKNSSTSNANKVYSNCVQSVRVGASCTIGDYAFYNCHSLASVSIPSGVTSIGSTNVFGNCYSLVSLSIPSDVTSFGNISHCYSLASVSIPSGVTSIGTQAFYYCYSLASVSIPSGVTSIGSSAFYYCYSLASVSIPSGVTSIGTQAFYYCYSLASSISIPSGVTSIANNTFYNCYGVSEYHFKATTPPTLASTNAFTNIQSDCVIYVPAASLTTYQTAENWSTYASYMVGE